MKRFWSRRDFLFESCGGLSGLALAHLLNQDGLLAATVNDAACDAKPVGFNPFAPKKPHFPPRAKSVISLFMSGGVSHVDTFDPKPALEKYAGTPLTGKGEIVVRQGHPGPLMPSPFKFRKYGQSGTDVSEIFPTIAQHVDDFALLRSVYGKSNDHVQAHYELAARISSYELAYRMQGCAPEAVDVSRESEPTRKLYGMDDKVTEPFARQCLMARRLVERGVRFVQLYHGGLGNQNTDTWDAHADVKQNHTQHAAEVDKPIAALLGDLKARGLLDTTLVTWQGEFGRMPISQRGVGRDHNPGAMSI